jgi:hypothetical protein
MANLRATATVRRTLRQARKEPHMPQSPRKGGREDVTHLEITRTRYNLAAVLGWVAVLVALVSIAVHYATGTFSLPRFVFAAIGGISGVITLTVAGPVKRVTTHDVEATVGAPDDHRVRH